MRERSRGFYRSLGADKANGNSMKSVTTHMATTSPATTPSDPAQGSQQPPHLRQNWSRPKVSSFRDATAKCPAEDTSDGSVFSLDFLRKFRCQRCLSHDHSTGSCKLPKMAFHSLRCPQRGLNHGALRFPDSQTRDSISYRCGKRGHMSRACPEGAPQKANGNSSQFNSVQVTESKDAGLPKNY
ncbi:Casein kinase I isoform delta [Perkinsus chesapeaki]|uniref:Casein kinase I isoform delta n=1 Tax=Perkinsus chesapeaki TaxID=330153 RepID=A0A7J6L4F1_PERCH|nr:Casein kinase I isoform delta [Perkinsus chesapeaki]